MSDVNLTESTPIDAHARLALLQIPVSGMVSGLYYVVGSEFGKVLHMWKVVLLVQLAASAALLLHYWMNRKARRLWVEGIVYPCVFAPLLMLGLVWAVYIICAPLPDEYRTLLLALCCSAIAWHALAVLKDFRRASKNSSVMQSIYHDNGSSLILRGTSQALIDSLTEKGPFRKGFMRVVIWFSPFAAAFGMSAGHFSDSGLNIVCIVLSCLGLSLTAWIIGNAYVKAFFFHIYLPLRLERATGKKVLLGA